jgi:hypothetical protein
VPARAADFLVVHARHNVIVALLPWIQALAKDWLAHTLMAAPLGAKAGPQLIRIHEKSTPGDFGR